MKKVPDGQLGLFDDVDDESVRTCLDCVHVSGGGEHERAHGLTFCYLRHNRLAWQDDGDDRPFTADAAQTCPKYMGEKRRSIREMYNPFDRAMSLHCLLYPGSDMDINFHRIWECCTVAYAQCPSEWFERTKSIRDVAEFIRDGRIDPPSMFQACYEVGIFDYDLDYHTCWDRCWAFRKGMPWHSAMEIYEWDYSKGGPAE